MLTIKALCPACFDRDVVGMESDFEIGHGDLMESIRDIDADAAYTSHELMEHVMSCVYECEYCQGKEWRVKSWH